MNEKKYYDFKKYLVSRFGEKVYKVTIDAGFSCPNRDGSKGTGGCIYCNSKGSRYRKNNILTTPIEEQIAEGKKFYKETQNARKFFAYFQTYTNTYADIATLKRIYSIPLKDDEIVGVSIGTRPDCVDGEKLDIIEDILNYKDEVWIEYGLQSIHEKTLNFINRGHSKDDFLKAVEITSKRDVKICVHIIAGLPYETKEMILETAKFVAELPVHGIKIHSLLLLKHTLMEKIYNAEPFPFLSQDEYVDIVCDILEILPENMVIQRLTGDGYRDLFLAPHWCRNKLKVLNAIDKELEIRNSYQGKFFK